MVKHIRKWSIGDPWLDEIDWNDMTEVLQDKDLSHAHKGTTDEGKKIDHADLTNVLPDQHHAVHVKTLADHPLSIIPTMDDAHIPDVETLSYGGAFALGQIPSIPETKLDFGTWKKVAEVSPESNVDYIAFNSLDINTDKFYMLFLYVKNPTGGDVIYYIFVEGDTTVTNYYNQLLHADGTTVVARRDNNSAFAFCHTQDNTLAWGTITRDTDGYFRYSSIESRRPASTVRFEAKSGAKTATVTNITTIRISASVSGGIGTGSRFILCKVRTA